MQLSEKTKNKLKGVMPVTKEEREDALASACMQVKRVLPEFTTKWILPSNRQRGVDDGILDGGDLACL